jgi:DNA-directed RNA polymerase subunit F
MIKNKDAVSLIEVKEILSEYPQSEENKRAEAVSVYIKKFAKIKTEKAKDLIRAIEELDMAKLKKEHIVKIVDVMPEDAEDLRKIFSGGDVTLNQDEISSILERVKQHK